jgi:DNA-binding GntR family transcriptional regulator
MVTNRPLLLKETAFQEMKRLILDGTFPPGSFLSERKLVERLNMSKTPIKAALERLEASGFIVTSPHQGIIVRQLSLREIKEHYDIRTALETFVVRQIAGTLRAEQIEAIRSNLAQQQHYLNINDTTGHVQADSDFHLLLASVLNNQEITQVMEHQRDKILHVAVQISNQNPARMQRSLTEHLEIAEAIFNGNGELAAARMTEHLTFGKRYLLDGE